MASIEGLTEEQCQQLAGLQVGDIVLIASYAKESSDDDRGDEGSDGESEASEGGGEDGEAEANDDDDMSASDGASRREDEDGSIHSVHDDAGAEDEDIGDSLQYQSATGVYVVLKIIKDDNDTMTDIILEELKHCTRLAEKNTGSFRSYHIYGSEVVQSDEATTIPEDFNDTAKASIKHLIDNINRDDRLYINCTGDDVSEVIFQGQCPARCRSGWVATQQEMHDMVEDDITLVTEHKPVCPICIGKDLMQEYQSLREMLESSPVDIGIVVEFLGRLNPRRRQLGYQFKQFDEREWGYLFDDINSEDEGSDNVNAGNTDGWGYWPEALDPNSCVVTSPASDAVIATLPRKAFAEVQKTEDDVKCLVCQEQFTDEVVVAELPCGHFFCDSGCIESWLKQFNNCPTCRKKLPSREDEQREVEINGVADSVMGGNGRQDSKAVLNGGDGTKMETDADGDADGAEENGEDVHMDEQWDPPRQIVDPDW